LKEAIKMAEFGKILVSIAVHKKEAKVKATEAEGESWVQMELGDELNVVFFNRETLRKLHAQLGEELSKWEEMKGGT
jgi:hypothetical protein